MHGCMCVSLLCDARFFFFFFLKKMLSYCVMYGSTRKRVSVSLIGGFAFSSSSLLILQRLNLQHLFMVFIACWWW
ncbi:hypothetical protein HOY80DRAFT_298404 [Tuber brumale]|nr:hypothetical protein HOY80DRAFT_298404 [Tuber brumale]